MLGGEIEGTWVCSVRVSISELAGSCGFEFGTHVIKGEVFIGGRKGWFAVPQGAETDGDSDLKKSVESEERSCLHHLVL